MVFTEEIFLFLFLPLVLGVYYLLPYRKEDDGKRSPFFVRNLWLTLAGYVFYAWFEPWFVLLMIWTNVFDYFCGVYLGRDDITSGRRKVALVLSMCMNLGLLAVFKYGVFAQVNLDRVLVALGHPGFEIFRIAFPIGISFYTFHSMSYVIDIYRGERPVRSFADFSCFVSLFPQLVAGPILRYNILSKQFHTRHHTRSLFSSGVILFFVGFAMKILLANPAGTVADAVFAAEAPSTLQAWWGALAYTFQIYFDFNGYSVMALGLGRMFGFELIRNFDAPYRSESITEFWRRWHISLSSWLREYLYFPLGGNRKGETRTYINLALVMLLGGFWHGAQWQFIVWGAIHGSWLALERWMGKRPFYGHLPRPLRIAVTMTIVVVAWVFFRAEDIPHALSMLGSMFGMGHASAWSGLLDAQIWRLDHLLVMGLCLVFVAQPFQSYEFGRKATWPRLAVSFSLFLVGLCFMYGQAFNPFLYFQF
ncbi:MAG TPA: MBOAT family O-acyltransferase [Fibrobacteria bacterium]|nr:MBOAT family O-acyltransferase [Fibrobacteria bacterium]HOX49955.1 MBOAT family O-acyltransferase [Fibrobacteria bacterium]